MMQKVPKEAAKELVAVLLELHNGGELAAARHSTLYGSAVYQGYVGAGIKALAEQLESGYFFKAKDKKDGK